MRAGKARIVPLFIRSHLFDGTTMQRQGHDVSQHVSQQVSHQLTFEKYHGLGNDFLIVDAVRAPWLQQRTDAQQAHDAVLLCDRHRGIGGDGVLTVLPPETPGAVARMLIHNADGSIPQMCGNGIRCFAKYLVDNNLVTTTEFVVDTGAGPLLCETRKGDDGIVATVRVNMGPARFDRAVMPMLPAADGSPTAIGVVVETDAHTFTDVTVVSMGNPHAIIFEPRTIAEATTLGPGVEHHPLFPQRINVEFVNVKSDAEADVVVWERGCGITEACGTGACAVVAAGVKRGTFAPGKEVQVNLPGGPLFITVPEDFRAVTMRGPATHVFTGTVSRALPLAAWTI